MNSLQQIIINQKQAKMFASEVYSDIAEYINTHQQEYKEFLLNYYNEEIKLKGVN